jgi:hypothetical protein
LSTQEVPAADYPKIRARFAGSRWPDLGNAGTAHVDLATQVPHARYTDGYQTGQQPKHPKGSGPDAR